ncbi:hypothetical protein PAXRUDRAFT_834165 [Paxillus rubicundulus Ve08.2h10]|uniref:Unplaced genomic scaffold scaffold_1485, whole genome shotgun sequence n=1 Tax=Paxillus rubicundulus Ve08.2h10 TaxID=930991 RepID=A0A0D0C8U3_9AGAM|nr:hypothetical protein PAXRUDRAFT_834165 [Paxillus rubicundulus Ve08.2h10]
MLRRSLLVDGGRVRVELEYCCRGIRTFTTGCLGFLVDSPDMAYTGQAFRSSFRHGVSQGELFAYTIHVFSKDNALSARPAS